MLIVDKPMPTNCYDCALDCCWVEGTIPAEYAEKRKPNCPIKGELVRCYECEHKSNKVKPVKGLAYCDYQQRIMYNTDFCNHGERKEQTDAAD